MSDFDELGEGALARLSDEELVAYIAAARAAGHMETARVATEILTYRLLPLVEARVAGKIPRDSVDDVVIDTFESFVRSAFDGKVLRSARAFIATIAKRRIADFHRKQERHPDQMPLAGEHEDEEDVFGHEAQVADEADAVAIRDAIERVLATRNEVHRQVIRLYGPEEMGGMNMSGEEVATAMADRGEPVSVANVQKIWQRFKDDLERELAAGDDEEGTDG